MTKEKAIEVLKSECYVFNPLNFDRTTLINTALDTVINELEHKGESVTEFANRCRKCGAECGRALKHKDEIIDKLLNTLIEYGDEDMPCYKCNNNGCDYPHPDKECWLKWAEAEVEADNARIQKQEL